MFFRFTFISPHDAHCEIAYLNLLAISVDFWYKPIHQIHQYVLIDLGIISQQV